jgi:hypothetical protein
MTQSPEYPDLAWSTPAAFGRGRDGKAVCLIVVHYTAGSETRTSAEDGAAYDRTRTDGTSTHYFVDRDSVVQEVLTRDRANAAFGRGNRLGIQYELCGTAQTRAQWLDAASDATLTNAARQMARDAAKYGIPVRRLSVAEVRSAWDDFPKGRKGFCGHNDITVAYGEGNHMDPGEAFPWDVLLDRVRGFIDGKDINDMALEGLDRILLSNTEHYVQSIVGLTDTAGGISDTVNSTDRPNALTAAVKRLTADVASIKATVAALSTGGIDPDALADALRDALSDPAVRTALVDAARAGAEAAEDS